MALLDKPAARDNHNGLQAMHMAAAPLAPAPAQPQLCAYALFSIAVPAGDALLRSHTTPLTRCTHKHVTRMDMDVDMDWAHDV